MKDFIKKRLRETLIDGINMNRGTQKLCNTMSVSTYEEGISLIINAIGTQEENPSMWAKISGPIKKWKEDNDSINMQKKTEHMSGDSMVDQSNTWWSAVQSTICETH